MFVLPVIDLTIVIIAQNGQCTPAFREEGFGAPLRRLDSRRYILAEERGSNAAGRRQDSLRYAWRKRVVATRPRADRTVYATSSRKRVIATPPCADWTVYATALAVRLLPLTSFDPFRPANAPNPNGDVYGYESF